MAELKYLDRALRDKVSVDRRKFRVGTASLKYVTNFERCDLKIYRATISRE